MEIYVILGQVFIFIAIIAAFLLLVAVMNKDGKESKGLSLVSSGIFFAATLIVLITAVLAGNKFLSAISASTSEEATGYSNKMGYAAVITAFVFAAITFAGNICRVVFGGKGKNDGEYIEVEPEEQPAEQAE